MRLLRNQQGLTQQVLAEKAEMEYKYLQKIESGRWPGLQLRTIEHLAGILKVEAWQLIAPPSGLHLKLEQPAPDQRIKPKPGRPRKIQVE